MNSFCCHSTSLVVKSIVSIPEQPFTQTAKHFSSSSINHKDVFIHKTRQITVKLFCFVGDTGILFGIKTSVDTTGISSKLQVTHLKSRNCCHFFRMAFMQCFSVKKTKGETENQAYNVYNNAFIKTLKRSMELTKENQQNDAKGTAVKF